MWTGCGCLQLILEVVYSDWILIWSHKLPPNPIIIIKRQCLQVQFSTICIIIIYFISAVIIVIHFIAIYPFKLISTWWLKIFVMFFYADRFMCLFIYRLRLKYLFLIDLPIDQPCRYHPSNNIGWFIKNSSITTTNNFQKFFMSPTETDTILSIHGFLNKCSVQVSPPIEFYFPLHTTSYNIVYTKNRLAKYDKLVYIKTNVGDRIR